VSLNQSIAKLLGKSLGYLILKALHGQSLFLFSCLNYFNFIIMFFLMYAKMQFSFMNNYYCIFHVEMILTT